MLTFETACSILIRHEKITSLSHLYNRIVQTFENFFQCGILCIIVMMFFQEYQFLLR